MDGLTIKVTNVGEHLILKRGDIRKFKSYKKAKEANTKSRKKLNKPYSVMSGKTLTKRFYFNNKYTIEVYHKLIRYPLNGKNNTSTISLLEGKIYGESRNKYTYATKRDKHY